MEKMHPDFGPVRRTLIGMGGAVPDVAAECPQADRNTLRIKGLVAGGSCAFLGGTLTLAAHQILDPGGNLHIAYLLGSISIAVLVAAVDNIAWLRKSYIASGEKFLREHGVAIRASAPAMLGRAAFVAIRLTTSVAIAEVTAVGAGLAVFGPDIKGYSTTESLRRNAPLIEEAQRSVDMQIARAGDAVTAQRDAVTSSLKHLTTLRQALVDPLTTDPQLQALQATIAALNDRKARAQDELASAQADASAEENGGPGTRAGRGPRFQGAQRRIDTAKDRIKDLDTQLTATEARLESVRFRSSSSAEQGLERAKQQIPSYEQNLAREKAELERLQERLRELVSTRATVLRAAVESAKNYVHPDLGVLAQLTTLANFAVQNTKIALFILAVHLAILGLELSVLAVKAAGIPTVYAVKIAALIHLARVAVAEETLSKLREIDLPNDRLPPSPPAKPTGVLDMTQVVPPRSPAIPPSSVKRGRGRPPKPRPVPTEEELIKAEPKGADHLGDNGGDPRPLEPA